MDQTNNINYVTGATYDAASSLTGFISGASSGFAGIANGAQYNPRLQICRSTALTSGSLPTSCIDNTHTGNVLDLGYNMSLGAGDNGNVLGITNYKDATRSQSFTYDPLNRLTSAQNAGTDCTKTTINGKTEYWGNSYGYDAWGNLLEKTPTKCSAENLNVTALANNQLSGYGYDAAGNMTHDATTNNNYLFDAENRIVGAAGFNYTYDADGNRVEKSNGSTGTLYWYMSPGIVAESDLSGNLQSEYVFFDGERVARKDFPSGAVSYYFSDHLKTASVITDSAGNITEDEDYYPWGGELQFLNGDSNHYKFTGKERDAETGLDYFGARYYGNWLGRFMSADWAAQPEAVPYSDLGDPQSLNLNSYVRNIPTSQTDPDGHCPECEELLEKVVLRLVIDHPKTAAAVAAVAEKTGETVVEGAEVAEEGAVSALGVFLSVLTLSQKTAGPEKDELHPKPGQIQPQLGQGRGADEEKSQSDIANERTRTNGGIVTDGLHRNDLDTTAPAEGYSLRDRKTGEVLKYGETTLGTKRYSQAYLDQHNARMVFEARGTKRQMHKWQHDKILEHKKRHRGRRPRLNRSDY